MPRPRYRKSVLRKNCRASVSYTPVSSPCSTVSILCGMRVNSWSKCFAASPVNFPRTWPKCAASSSSAVNCEVNALVDATPISGPAGTILTHAGPEIGVASYHRAHHVADGQRWRTLYFCFTLAREGVGRFARLADAYGQSLAVENGIAIAELAAVVDLHLHARQPLDHEFPGQARMPARSAGDDAHLLEFAELLLRNCHVVQENLSGVLRNAAEQRVADGARLLENLFLHEVLVAALFRHDRVPRDVLRGALDRAAVMVHHTDALLGEYGDVAVGEKKYLARML